MFDRLSQEQFEYVLNVLILYKQINKEKNVYLNDSSAKEALAFVNKAKSNIDPSMIKNVQEQLAK